MDADLVFRAANAAALASWIAVIFLPRGIAVRRAIQFAAIGGLCSLYAALILVYFFRVEGGGFGTLAQVQALFAAPQVALAGWVHYLAIDLFVGLWIAQRCDEAALPRLLQAPILATTFMFGPIGLLLASGMLARPPRAAGCA
jgi:hypothetical protein